MQPCARAALRHQMRRLTCQQIGVGAPQQQGGAADRVVGLPQRGFAGGRQFGRDGPKRQRDGRVVVRPEPFPFAAVLDQHRSRQRVPLLGAVRTKAGRDAAQVIAGLLQAVPTQRQAQVGADAHQRFRFDRWADVVEHQAAHGRSGQRRHAQTDQTAHRGADPVERLCVDARQQRHHVGHVLRRLVAGRVGQPVRLSAPGHVGADHAVFALHRLRQGVEVAALARQAMHAQQHARIGRIAPLPVGHTMQAVLVEAWHVIQARQAHRQGRL